MDCSHRALTITATERPRTGPPEDVFTVTGPPLANETSDPTKGGEVEGGTSPTVTRLRTVDV